MSDRHDTHERLRRFWNADAETYDRGRGHAAGDPIEAAAWRAAMARYLPTAPARVLDCGAGTGAMSLLAAELGYDVTALDISSEMLAKLRAKAESAARAVTIVEGPADEPPDGPFDAVIERHLIWTVPDPVAALEAWRRVAPGGRLVLFEGEWGKDDPVSKVRKSAGRTIRKLMSVPSDHHRSYEPELVAELPFSRRLDAHRILDAVARAGWKAARIERLYDVEWARAKQSHPALRPFEGVAHFAIVADA